MIAIRRKFKFKLAYFEKESTSSFWFFLCGISNTILFNNCNLFVYEVSQKSRIYWWHKHVHDIVTCGHTVLSLVCLCVLPALAGTTGRRNRKGGGSILRSQTRGSSHYQTSAGQGGRCQKECHHQWSTVLAGRWRRLGSVSLVTEFCIFRSSSFLM